MIEKRNMWIQCLLFIITLGIYGLYWYYVTTKEMAEYTETRSYPYIFTIALMVPPLCFLSFYEHGWLFEELTEKNINRWFMFLFWIAFPPVVWAIVQLKLNQLYDGLEDADEDHASIT